MIYIKSILVGIVTLFVATVVYIAYQVTVLSRRYPSPLRGEVGFDLSIFVYPSSYWLIALAAFAIGFYCEYRHDSH